MTKKDYIDRTAADLMQAQVGARKFALDYLSKEPLGLPEELDDDTFGKVMNAITRGLAAAYAAGFMAAKEER